MIILITGSSCKNLLDHKFLVFLSQLILNAKQVDRYLKIDQIDFIIHCEGVIARTKANIENLVESPNKNLSMGDESQQFHIYGWNSSIS